MVIGGCVVCDSDVEHYEKIKAPVFRKDGFYTLWMESVGKPDDLTGALVLGPRITGRLPA